MIKNYLTLALRTLWRHRGQTVLNAVGLSLGIASCLLIALYIRDELSYDRFHEHAADIYRVHIGDDLEVTPTIVAPLATRTLPSVAAATRLYDIGQYQDLVVQQGERRFLESRVFYADSTVFEVFSFPFLAGLPEAALSRPNTLVLTAAMAEKYFGSENPVGRTILIDSRPFEVTGVLAPIPETSHIRFDFLASFTSTRWATIEQWDSANFFTYLRLQPGANPVEVERALGTRVDEARLAGEVWPEFRLVLQPLLEIHLVYEGRLVSLYVLATIGLLLLVIACVNYVNLTTARAMYRAREVGIRKAAGAHRSQLIAQYLGESLVLAVIAGGVGLLIAVVGLPGFNALSGKNLTLLADPAVGLMWVGVVLVVGLAGGAYPAFLLSAFRPASILKGATSAGGNGRLRRALVVFQFTATVVLLLATLVVSRQLAYMRDKDLGFDKEHVVALPIPYGDQTLSRAYEALREAMLQLSTVTHVARVNHLPGYQEGGYGLVREGSLDEEPMPIAGIPSDARVVETLGLRLLAGSDFRPVPADSITSGSYQYLLNEKAVVALGWTPENAVGQRVTLSGNRWGTIVGVIADYHFLSLHEVIEPMAYFVEPWATNYIVARIQPGQTREAIAGLEALWSSWMPERPFAYTFLDAELDRLYLREAQTGRVFALGSVLAIVIACMGLFGLAAFSAARRTKEIGIRKVLGAGVGHLVVLLSREFTALVLISFVLGAPMAYLFMQSWQEAFAYQAPGGWVLFPVVGAGVLAIAWLTVSYQAIRTALADPVDSLRYE